MKKRKTKLRNLEPRVFGDSLTVTKRRPEILVSNKDIASPTPPKDDLEEESSILYVS